MYGLLDFSVKVLNSFGGECLSEKKDLRMSLKDNSLLFWDHTAILTGLHCDCNQHQAWSYFRPPC